ncbi:uncharacterized protein LOC132755205 [Ruditapes philippinarum]|uniref:uncharacterized protein LOC132755205 n=1 Tax=Ruditapes philippinarum TaxID=129788 RepID=UPI00295A5E82|nr:uncharacterized protein LOC132755205 [Ruditapes philippinarum]
MCKTVLLHCIENTEPSIWQKNSLLTCLTNCLLKLHSCVQNDHLSHFIIQENNLMAGQFTAGLKHELSEKIIDFVQSYGQRIFRIDIDDLGHRLQVKLNKVPQRAYNFNSCRLLSASYYLNLALQSSSSHRSFLNELHNKDIRTLEQSVKTLMEFSKNGNKLEQDSFQFLAPFILTTYGTALASSSIGENNQVSSETMDLLSDGSDSDVSSSRLKLASVLYCTGDMEKAERILGQTEQQFYSHPVTPVCGCPPRPPQELPTEFMRICTEQSEDCIKHITAFCVRFTQLEINCAPHEIQYEMFRSTQDDMIHRDQHDLWMNWAVVDSLPFLYFLQYKIYGHLQRHLDRQKALNRLFISIEVDKNLKHRETALNILGQIMEQENRPQDALEYYIRSLQQRARNNAANFHICKLLSGLMVSQ